MKNKSLILLLAVSAVNFLASSAIADTVSDQIVFSNSSASFDLVSNKFISLRDGYESSLEEEDLNQGIWTEFFGSNVSQNNSAALEGYKANSRGFAFVLRDGAYDSSTGISVNYVNSDVKSRSGLRHIDINSYQFNAYTGEEFGKFFINYIIGFVWNEYKSDRAIPDSVSVATANYDGQNYIARLESGYDFIFGSFVIAPMAIATIAHNITSGYSEGSAGEANLSVKSTSSNFLEARGGIVLSNKFKTSQLTIEPQIITSYGYNFADVKQGTNSNFIGQSNVFDPTTSNIERESLKIGFGAKIYNYEAFVVSMNYIFEHRVNYQASSVLWKMDYRF